MKKAICSTTINPPTEALHKFIGIAEADDWQIFMAGDVKTPHASHYELSADHEGCYTYLDPLAQQRSSKELSDALGWNCIQRRNMAILEALRWGADVVALVDDDNIPLEGWGQNLTIGTLASVVTYPSGNPYAFNPLDAARISGVPDRPPLWHRGFPVQLVQAGPVTELVAPLVQADLWNGEPDVDAVCRIAAGGSMDLNFLGVCGFYRGDKAGPFNSQNTFLHRSLFSYYFLFPEVGRGDDIFASYVTQRMVPGVTIYGPPSVRQERNPHDLSKDLEAEVIVYRHTLDLIMWLQDNDPLVDEWPAWMPRAALDAWRIWRNLLK